MSIKSLLKEFTPPFFIKKLSSFFYGWSGNYSSWEEASKKCSGYNSSIIFDKVKTALLKVKNGEAVFERDSVLFDKIHYSFPLLSALSQVALNRQNKLNVLDFGGSLGSSYYQNKNFFLNLSEFNWCIVEQEHFVKEGQKTFADQHLHFFYDIDACLKTHSIEVFLLGSVLQYLEKPYEFLDAVFAKKIPYLIIDRTPLLLAGNDRITIQTIPENIYKAQYPCWLLNNDKLLNYILKEHDLLYDEQTTESIHINNAAIKSFFFKRKNVR